jgi:phosphoenolpyruvate carboxykinase (GTP)
MLDRIEERADATETPIGDVPAPGSLDLDGLAIPRESLDELLRVDPGDWTEEVAATGKFFEKFGNRLPDEIRTEHKALADRLQRSSVVTK